MGVHMEILQINKQTNQINNHSNKKISFPKKKKKTLKPSPINAMLHLSPKTHKPIKDQYSQSTRYNIYYCIV